MAEPPDPITASTLVNLTLPHLTVLSLRFHILFLDLSSKTELSIYYLLQEALPDHLPQFWPPMFSLGMLLP